MYFIKTDRFSAIFNVVLSTSASVFSSCVDEKLRVLLHVTEFWSLIPASFVGYRDLGVMDYVYGNVCGTYQTKIIMIHNDNNVQWYLRKNYGYTHKNVCCYVQVMM